MPTSASNPTSPRRVRSALSGAEALALRATGAPYHEVAAGLGCSERHARRLVARALGQHVTEAAHELRAIEGARLDALQHAHWDAALDGDVPATVVVLRVMERRARLFGLDAPTRVAVSDETSQAITTLLDEMEARLGG